MKRAKSILVGMICFMMLMPTVVSASKPEDWGDVDIGDMGSIPACEAGKEVKINLPIVNLGGSPVTNVRVYPIRNADPTIYPFTTDKTNVYMMYGSINPGESEAVTKEFTFVVRKDVLTKEYTLKFGIEYTVAGTQKILTKEAFINANGIEAKPTTAPKPTKEPQPKPTTDPQITPAPTIEESEGEGGGSGGGGDYGGGESGGGGSSSSETEQKTGTPRIIIESFRTNPKVVNAGSSFKLILEIRNTSKKTAVSNMEINLQAAGVDDGEGGTAGPATGSTSSDVFLPDKGSNTLYLDSIAANSTKEVSIDLTARADLQQRPYSIGISMKYEDSKAEQFDAMADISVPIKQEARFELSKVDVAPQNIEVGGEGNVVFSIYNLGRTKLYNVKVELIGDSVTGGEAFVGNLEAGATGEVDLMVTGASETTDDGTVKIQVTYEDQDGKPNSFEDSCNIHVMPAMEQGGMLIDEEMMNPEGGRGGLSIPAKVGIGAGAVAVVGLGTFGIIRHRRKKEEDFTDEFLGSDKDERK